MRRALASLTGRGQAFIGLGVVVGVLAFVLSDRDIARFAVVLILLPLLSIIVTARSRSRLTSNRSVSNPRVAAGDSVEVKIRIDNVSRVPSGVLLAEDTLPYAFGGRPRFVVDRLSPQAGVDVHYPVRCELRGRYQLGPLTVRLRDPFGLSERTRSFSAADELVVTPSVVRLPSVQLGGEWAGLGETTRRSVASAGEDDAATREYRLGDDLRRVHWRSTARRGELMVKREEQPWASRAALLLDTRASVHSGSGAASSLEWSISAIASIGAFLDGADFGLRLVFDNGITISGGHAGERFVDVLLDSLATTEPSRSSSLGPALATLGHGGGEGLIVAVIGAIEEHDVEAMIRARGSGVTGVAILVAANATGTDEALERTARLLGGSGWRVVLANRNSEIKTVWQQAGTRLVAGRDPETMAATP